VKDPNDTTYSLKIECPFASDTSICTAICKFLFHFLSGGFITSLSENQ
jgi:hypothetical protein